MSDPLLTLVCRRQELRDAVLTAIMASGDSAQISAWQDVDEAAIALARERRRYNRYIRGVIRNAEKP